MSFNFSEEKRKKLALFSSVASLICIVPSLMVFSAGIYIQVAVQTKIRLIEGFDVSALPGYIITVGFLSLVYNSINAAFVFLSRKKKKRVTFSPRLFPLVICGLVLFFAIFAAGCVCFIQISHLDESFKKGILIAMKDYKDDVKQKEEIDLLQIDYECCGSDKYTDWFNVEWRHEELVKKTGKQTSGDVPFSCCNVKSRRPCIHNDVHSDNVYYNYNYNNHTTLHWRGCRHVLVDFYGHTLLTDVGALIIAISFLQIISVVLTRLVQTSMVTAIQRKNPFGPALAHIFCQCAGAGDGDDTQTALMQELMQEAEDDDDSDSDDSTFDEMSDSEQERLLAKEPLYANISLNSSLNRFRDRTTRPKSTDNFSDIYEVPYVGGGKQPSPVGNARASRPSLPKVSSPPLHRMEPQITPPASSNTPKSAPYHTGGRKFSSPSVNAISRKRSSIPKLAAPAPPPLISQAAQGPSSYNSGNTPPVNASPPKRPSVPKFSPPPPPTMQSPSRPPGGSQTPTYANVPSIPANGGPVKRTSVPNFSPPPPPTTQPPPQPPSTPQAPSSNVPANPAANASPAKRTSVPTFSAPPPPTMQPSSQPQPRTSLPGPPTNTPPVPAVPNFSTPPPPTTQLPSTPQAPPSVPGPPSHMPPVPGPQSHMPPVPGPPSHMPPVPGVPNFSPPPPPTMQTPPPPPPSSRASSSAPSSARLLPST